MNYKEKTEIDNYINLRNELIWKWKFPFSRLTIFDIGEIDIKFISRNIQNLFISNNEIKKCRNILEKIHKKILIQLRKDSSFLNEFEIIKNKTIVYFNAIQEYAIYEKINVFELDKFISKYQFHGGSKIKDNTLEINIQLYNPLREKTVLEIIEWFKLNGAVCTFKKVSPLTIYIKLKNIDNLNKIIVFDNILKIYKSGIKEFCRERHEYRKRILNKKVKKEKLEKLKI